MSAKSNSKSNAKSNKWQGVWTAVVTPFDKKGNVDFRAFRKILQHQRKARVTGVIPCGTTGESPTLSSQEKRALIETCLEELEGSGVKVIAGTGSNDTQQTVEFSKWASAQGVDGLLVVTPYYNKPTAAGLFSHFSAIADASTRPLMLYQVPGRTGIKIPNDVLARLSKHPNIRALKEASSDAALTSEIRASCAPKFEIFSGDDPTFLSYLAVGAVGVVSVASNVIPSQMVALWNAWCGQKREAALKLHDRYFEFFKTLFIESNPGPVKQALQWIGLCSADLRLPLAKMTEKNQSALKSAMKRAGIPWKVL